MRTMEDVSGEDLDWFWREWLYGTDSFDAGPRRPLGRRRAGRRSCPEQRRRSSSRSTVEFTFTDGTTERAQIPVEAWMVGDQAAARIPLNGRTVRSARLDPDGLLPDTDRANDTATM